jgi:N-acyl-D-aspartate/D-glutamate deacylase
MHDLVIRNALLLDGTDSAPVRGDLGVTQGLISAVGKVNGPAKETLQTAWR